MKRYKTQICLVFDHTIANIIPILDDKIRPDNVILCAPEKRQNQAERLAEFIKGKGISVRIVQLGNRYDIRSLKTKLLDLASEFNSNKEVAINLTGGRKIMSIAALMVFKELGFDCFYVMSDSAQIIMLNDIDKEFFNIQDQLNIEEFFFIHGYNVTNRPKRNLMVPDESRELFSRVLADTAKFHRPLGTLNYLASQAERGQTLTVHHDIPEDCFELLDLFNEHGAISYFDDKKVVFNGAKGRNFCHGFWLEDHIYLEMKKIDNAIGLQDFACSVEIANDHAVPNELDGVFIYNNHLYVIECKTARMDAKGTNVVYKSDTIKNYTGINTKSVIATFKHLNEHDLQRAEDLDIIVISGDDLANFSERMLEIMKPQIKINNR